MQIGILDDEPLWLDIIEEKSMKILDELHATDTSSIHKFSQEDSLFFSLDSLDLLLLDVELTGTDGFTVAREIRKNNPDLCIIFLTSHDELAAKGYPVGAFRYVQKGDWDALKEALSSALSEMTLSESIILHAPGIGDVPVYLRNILYLETYQRKLLYHLTSGDSLLCSGSMQDFIEKYSHRGFYMIHRSYIVNFAHIQSFTRQEVTFNKDLSLAISPRKEKSFRAAYFDWKFRKETLSCSTL